MKPIQVLRMRNAAPAGGLYGDHPYWRVFVTDNWGDATGVYITEVEFLDGTGTVITATGGTAIGSDDSPTNEFAKAFDGILGGNTWFADSGPTNQWIGYQYPTAKGVEQVRITTPTSGATNALTRMPKNCKLEYSDNGTTWTTAFSFFSVNLFGGSITYPETLATGFHKFWRCFVPAVNSGSLTVCKELELRATSGAADQSPTQTTSSGGSTGRPLYSGQASGNDAYKAFNDNGTTDAWAVSATTNQWIGFLFPEAKKVEEIAWTGWTTNQWNPTSILVQYSDDGTTWTTQKTISSLTWTGNETKVLAAV